MIAKVPARASARNSTSFHFSCSLNTIQGNAANSSAAYNAQLSNVAKADYDYKTSRNKDYKDLGLSDDGLPWNTVGRAANRLFSGIANYFSK